MRLIYTFAAFLILGVSSANANDTYFGVSYKIMDADFKDLGGSLDLTGSSLVFGRQINDKLKGEIALTTYVDYKLEGISAEVTSTDISLLYFPSASSFFFKAGITDGEASLSGVGDDWDGKTSDSPLFYGLGFDFNMGSSTTLRLDYTTISYEDVGEVDLDGLSITVLGRF